MARLAPRAFSSIDNTRFKRPVVPGDRLMMQSEMVADRRGLMKFKLVAFVDDELACTAEITCMERKL